MRATSERVRRDAAHQDTLGRPDGQAPLRRQPAEGRASPSGCVKDCDVLIFDEPTRGIDVGAKQEIYRLLNELAGQASRSS